MKKLKIEEDLKYDLLMGFLCWGSWVGFAGPDLLVEFAWSG